MSKKLIKKSQLLPLGIVLILCGMFFPMQITTFARSMDPGSTRTLLLLSTELFRLCFFIGVGCAIIGGLRNKKMEKLQKANTDNPKPPPPPPPKKGPIK